MDLKNKNIIITGGSSGIGKATALSCLRQGARVAIVSRNPDKFVVQGISSYACDVSDKSAVVSTIQKIINDLGHIDILINNAGYATYQTFAELSLDEIDHLTKVNYLGFIYFSKVTLDHMIHRRSGHVINVASVAGKLPITPNLVYAAAKHGVVALTELLKYEYAPFGIKFSLMLPGRVDTPFFDHETFKRRQAGLETKGMIPAETVANAIVKQIKTGSYLTVLPRRFKLIFWVHETLPWLFKPLLKFVLQKRIKNHYDQVGWPVIASKE